MRDRQCTRKRDSGRRGERASGYAPQLPGPLARQSRSLSVGSWGKLLGRWLRGFEWMAHVRLVMQGADMVAALAPVDLG